MDASLVTGLIALGLAAVGGATAIELEQRARGPRQTVELRFGRDVTPEAVVAVLDQIAGMQFGASVALGLRADHRSIRHFLSSDQATLDTLRGGLGALLPGLRLVPHEQESGEQPRFGRSVRLRGRLGSLREDNLSEVSAGLLAAVQPLGPRESVWLRWLIRPGAAAPVPTLQHGVAVEPEERRRLRTKNAGSVVRARGVVAATAGHPKRAAHLLSRVSSVLRSRSTPYGQLRGSPRRGWLLTRETARRSFLIGDRYSAAELAGLLAWPIDAPTLPGLSLGTSPVRLPSPRLPRHGRVLGISTWPGEERPIAQPLVGALSHSLIAGPTGVGKSTLLMSLMAADLAAGRGLVLIDGKGDTAASLLARIPKDRRDDVICLDCASPGPLPGLKLFAGPDPGLAADVVLGVLADLFRDSWGPLSERYLRAGLTAVAHDPEGTLADVPFVYSDAAYRRNLVGRLHDPIIRSAFAAYDSMSPGERLHQLAAPLNKLGQLLGRPVVRTVLGQPDPKLDFRAALRGRKIVVISLAPARVGSSASRLIGALSVFGLFQAVQARSGLSESARVPFLVYIDEPKALGDLPMPLDALLEQARGLGVGLTLAPQSMAQLPKSVRDAALTNVATRVVFRQHADDARLLARDLPGVTPEDVGDLAAYEAVARIGLGPGDVAPPVTIRTAAASKQIRDPKLLIDASARRYGVSLADVDAALLARHQSPADSAPVGRKRRAS